MATTCCALMLQNMAVLDKLCTESSEDVDIGAIGDACGVGRRWCEWCEDL
jgi:hypothetical protein